MAATWLLAVALVRIPATRRICLVRNGRALSVLCWQFCILWVALRLYDYDDETKATWSLADSLKQTIIIMSSSLAWGLHFMVMLSFWGNLKWKHPIMTACCLAFGMFEEELHLIPSEDDLQDSVLLSSLLYEDHDLSHLSDSELDEKPSKLEV
ncbi:hypothetical protein BD769DRAFT_1416126 [Suillus cothurnatus]|nr:hypothetical protein BD769DRAFT_1416126 [Suillus cothurnatus]